MKRNKGITLIALIITIIVMLILVGISITVVLNSNILSSAKNAGKKWQDEARNEANLGNKITIDGITYNSIEEYLSSEDLSSGEKYYYETLALAITDANASTTANGTADESTANACIIVNKETGDYAIKVLKEQTITEVLPDITGIYTIDMNGKKINLSSKNTIFTIKANAKLTIQDSIGTGVMDMTSTATDNQCSMIDVYPNGELNVVNGQYRFVILSDEVSNNQSLFSNTFGKITLENPTCYFEGKRNTASLQLLQSIRGENIIHSGNYTAKGEQSISTILEYGGKLRIDAGTFWAGSSTREEKTVNTIFGAIGSEIIINGGNFEADIGPLSNSMKAVSAAVWTADDNTNLTINGGTFKATDMAICLQGNNTAKIKNAVLKGVTHGGAYFSNSISYVKDTEFVRIEEYDGIYPYDENDWSSSNMAVFYTGGSVDTTVYMDNCRMNYGISALSTSHNHHNTYFYASNTNFPLLRVDGTNTDGYSAYFYQGSGATYHTYNVQGTVDSETYKDTVFCQDI